MAKRKRETADGESATSEHSKKIKKKKRDTTSTPQAKATSKIVPKQFDIERSIQVSDSTRDEKHARRHAKREKKRLEKKQRDESGCNDGVKTRADRGDTGSAEIQRRKSLEKLQTRNRQKSRKREEEGGQQLTGKHKSKGKRRKDKIERSNGKRRKEKDVVTVPWKVSDPLGGQMLDADPVFSPDEK